MLSQDLISYRPRNIHKAGVNAVKPTLAKEFSPIPRSANPSAQPAQGARTRSSTGSKYRPLAAPSDISV